MASQASKINFDRRREENVQRVFRTIGFQTWRDFDNFIAIANDAFSYEKARSQFTIVPRRAHGNGDAFTPHANFEWFLSDDCVSMLLRLFASFATQYLNRNSC